MLRGIWEEIRGASRAVRGIGIRGTIERQLRRVRDRRDYQRWLRERDDSLPSTAVVHDGRLVSVLMPTHDSDPRWLARAIESVRAQTYANWEVCIADDASSRPGVREQIAAAARGEPRIHVVLRPDRGHISAASNSALAIARGEFVALLDHDDELAPQALGEVAALVRRYPDTDVAYSDEDKIDLRGRRIDAYFKPDFSPDLLLSQNLVSHLGLYRTSLVRDVGGFREGFEGSQDHDLALRVIERSSPDRVRHIPALLYHWRMTTRSTSGGLWRKDYAQEAGSRAIAEHLVRTGRRASVARASWSWFRVRYAMPDPRPSVTVVAVEPTVTGLHEALAGGDVELTRVPARGSREGLADAINRAVRGSRGEVVVLLGPTCQPLPGWLEELVAQASRAEVGVAGGKVLSKDRRILHAGYLLALDRDSPVVDAHRGLPDGALGHFGRADLVQNFLAVGPDCLAIRREVFDSLDGLDAAAFPSHLFSVDLCLRAREKGLRVLFTPYARVVQRSPAQDRAGDARERARLASAWGERVPLDPYWHPALDRSSGSFRLSGS
jgi:GT2 family glycosyltransferase